MNQEDKKIQDLLRAYSQTPPSGVFVQKVMRAVRQDETPRPVWSSWFTRMVWVGAAVAALLFAVHPRQPVNVTPEEPAIIYVASLIDTPAEETDPDTEQLIESYFL